MQTITTNSCGDLRIFIKGKINESDTVFITVHDIGVNHNEFLEFFQSSDMLPIADKFTMVHVILPGQNDQDEDLPHDYKFPTLNDIASGIGEICEALSIKGCIVFGEGSGAYICACFCMLRDDLVNGAVLLNLTGSSSSFLESIKDKLTNFKGKSGGLDSKMEAFLLNHRFGTVKEKNDEHELRHSMEAFKESFKTSINARNVHYYIESFTKRKSIIENVDKIRCPVLFLTGEKSPYLSNAKNFYEALCSSLKDDIERKTKNEFIEVEDIGNVIRERQEKAAEYILYFMQGLGFASGVVSRRVSSYQLPKIKGISMGDFDKPRGTENLFYQSDRKYSNAIDMQADINKLLEKN